MSGLLWLVAGIVGCSATPSLECVGGEGTLVAAEHVLTCAASADLGRYARVLSGRAPDPDHITEALAAAFVDDPAGTLHQVSSTRAELLAFEAAQGLVAAELRSTRAWELTHGAGPLTGRAGAAVIGGMSVWEADDAERLVLTEADIEGWIRYASLCREVQGGKPLRLSIVNRVPVYAQARERFIAADRGGKVAMTAIGPFWGTVETAWQSAAYEDQQRWAKRAPLPPPMNASAMGYLETLLAGDLTQHAEVLHQAFGPMPLDQR